MEDMGVRKQDQFLIGMLLVWLTLLIWIWVVVTAGPVNAGELTARQIMELVDARDDGDNSTQDMEMILIDKRGNERVRKLRAFSRFL